ncbi:hypothetical protein [Methylocapsa sp. S129]|uniref:hypothetical protein n=1 Tax=Methylocapsa sp. S129 TaxID=1641869 RepID=UPI00131C76FD|nr:hypothetical protein [Methylocapsa sp. S129]
MRQCLITATLLLALAETSPALAQVPVADTAREAKETQTAGCMARAAVAKSATVQPSQGLKGSMVAPSPAAPSAAVGGTNVLGAAPAAGTTGAGLGSFTGSTVSGIDFSALTGAPSSAASPSVSTLGQSSVATVGQATNSLSGLTSALQSNNPALVGAGLAIGTLSAAQSAWNQNTSARIGGASVWGQAIQIGTLAVQLRNLMLLQQTARASGQAQVMTYNAATAVLVNGAPTAPDNSTASVVGAANYAAVAAALSAAQKAASAAPSVSVTPLWAGVAPPQQSLAEAKPAAAQ